jgi:NAD(P)H-hydrate epimerase
MERAGYAAFLFLTRVAAPHARRFLIVTGKGNNAGDAFVVARYLLRAGCQVTLLPSVPADALRDDALANWRALERLMSSARELPAIMSIPERIRAWQGDVIVDGLLGTGLQGDVCEEYRAIIEAINARAIPVLALDVPSGLNGDTGTPCGTAIRATWTVTFGHAKRGMLEPASTEFCGRVEVIDIGLERGMPDDAAPYTCQCLSACEAQELLPRRMRTDHKRSLGHVGIIAGSRGMTGAAVLSAQAALAAGAGVVTAAIPAACLELVAPCAPACMTLSLPDDGSGVLHTAAIATLTAAMSHFDALVLGPGLGQATASGDLLAALLPAITCPVVIDADALNLIAARPTLFDALPRLTVMTPHPGEFARLAPGIAVDATVDARVQAARLFVEQHAVTLLLKGFQTVIAQADATFALNLSGNAGMATAGSGDVLSGVVGTLLAQRLTPFDAARLAAFIHGLAGDIAAGHKGLASVTAPDIITYIGAALRYIQAAAAL